MSNKSHSPEGLPEESSEYLQMFLDETEEQLEDLTETMLVLERDLDNTEELNEAFRLIHSIKGSAGMLGFDHITILTHHLENRFERFRSGAQKLDPPMTSLVLRCIDYLRDCNERLRAGQGLIDAGALLEELHTLEAMELDAKQKPEPKPEPSSTATTGALTPEQLPAVAPSVSIRIEFEPGLQLVDLKAQLIVSRLSGLGEVLSTRPSMDEIEDMEDLSEFVVVLATTEPLEELRAVADVDGARSVTIESAQPATPSPEAGLPSEELVEAQPASEPPPESPSDAESTATLPDPQSLPQASAPPQREKNGHQEKEASGAELVDAEPSAPTEKSKAKGADTVRVDIHRLDNLMNLAGELVINRARFVQVSGKFNPELKKSNFVNRLRDFGSTLGRIIEGLKVLPALEDDWLNQIQELERGLELITDQAQLMESTRGCFGQMTEAIDQLTRVSDKLQRGVLETRMVPVGPLFNRFKRVVRDLAVERGKSVHLVLRGEKTEIDKRMIDEMGDPLVHLVRNSIDHGLESPEVRAQRGKPEVGTILLEASHSGHHVYIRAQDDGAGIDLEKIKAKIVDKGLLSFVAVEELSEEEVLEYIWHPGFSTAEAITNVSGRGVGMDVVMTRIRELNGTIEVESVPHQGTTFTIRLPLTLAIINSLLIRARDVVFSIPICDVREIVAIRVDEIVSVRGHETFEVRGEFVPLSSMDEVFEWNDGPWYHPKQRAPGSEIADLVPIVHVVILQSGGRTMGFRVDALLGGQEIVIKSLSENFVSIRGLSGASILGDGSVCLMLDVAALMELALQSSRSQPRRKESSVVSVG